MLLAYYRRITYQKTNLFSIPDRLSCGSQGNNTFVATHQYKPPTDSLAEALDLRPTLSIHTLLVIILPIQLVSIRRWSLFSLSNLCGNGCIRSSNIRPSTHRDAHNTSAFGLVQLSSDIKVGILCMGKIIMLAHQWQDS